MGTTQLQRQAALAVLVLLVSGSAASASSGSFVITGVGITLGEAKEDIMENGQPQPPRFLTKVELGQPFTLNAQGMVYPKGAKPQPSEPDAGKWQFDNAAFKLVPPTDNKKDKTMISIRLQPTALGQTRIRFVGQILGYDRTFDVMVEVVAPKK